jgi:hypothetical protein
LVKALKSMLSKQSKWHQVFALLDDIAAIMDDVAVMSKVAPKNGRYFRR